MYTFQRNIRARPGKTPGKRCMEEFWKLHPKEYKFVTSNTVTPADAMAELASDLTHLYRDYEIQWLANPAAFDWQWLKAYYEKFGPNPKPFIGYTCICLDQALTTYCEMISVSYETIWNELIGASNLTHNPLDDARVQAMVYLGLRKKIQSFKSCS